MLPLLFLSAAAETPGPPPCTLGGRLPCPNPCEGAPDGQRPYAEERVGGGPPLTGSLWCLDGAVHGEVVLRDAVGVPLKRITFSAGKKHGLEEVWREDGVLVSRWMYEDGRPIWRERLPNGVSWDVPDVVIRQALRGSFQKSGPEVYTAGGVRLEGEHRVSYPAGHTVHTFRDGLLEGETRTYDHHGNHKKTECYWEGDFIDCDLWRGIAARRAQEAAREAELAAMSWWERRRALREDDP